MKPSTVEVLTWVFIYGGSIVFVLGIFVRRAAEGLGLGFMLGGAIVALIGVGLIWLRSRMDNPKKERDE